MKKLSIIYAVFLSMLLLIPAFMSISADEPTDECMPTINLPTDAISMTAQLFPPAWESTFKIGLTGIYGQYDVTNGTYLGWCVQYGRAHNPIPIQVTLQSSYDPPSHITHENWSKINYILNHKQGTRVDIQRAIWYFINFGPWSWDREWGPMSGEVTQETWNMIENATLYADDWCPLCCDVIAVICDQGTPRQYQLMIIEVPLRCYEFKDQTAWAANGNEPGKLRYTPRGNWATYTAYDGEEKTVTLFAGKTIPVGNVTFSAPSDGNITITITLSGDWEFEDVKENVKIQDYKKAPTGNPAPGLFAHKANATDSPFSIEVPENNFYGVHVNVGYWVEINCED